MPDITHLINNTRRQIVDRQIGSGKARALVLHRRYDAEIDDVWQACTDPERMSRWFLKVTGDLRPGGTYQLDGNAGGQILRCEPPRLLRVTWVYPEHPTGEVELRLSPDPTGGTVFELEYALPVDDFPTEALGIGPGWEPALYALDLHLRDKLPDISAEKWRNGELPTEVVDLIDESTRLWATLVDGTRQPSGD
jgi:uncharacterized protein YndB with AHSA1/START domain